MWIWIQSAMAMDLAIVLEPTDGALSEPVHCSVSDVRQGELLTLPAMVLGEATVVPMVEIAQLGQWGVLWLSALRVTTVAGDYPALMSIARPDRGLETRRPCVMQATCRHTYTRDEQSMTLSMTASGSLQDATAEPGEIIWKTTSWYRPAREVVCGVAPPVAEPVE